MRQWIAAVRRHLRAETRRRRNLRELRRLDARRLADIGLVDRELAVLARPPEDSPGGRGTGLDNSAS